ncbi:surfeit locus protein 5 subunit 22 of mediator complex-domain-containing protein [Cyathus striatus]|nr:surfeit locus protein 5 subunit 22 of mediator complex-domain-containing protein [Cyathus striatus]
MAEPQTDVSLDQDSAEYLDTIEEEWNKRVDNEVETLVDGMVDLVSLASIADKDKFRIAQESFQAESRAESMVRAAHSLLSITHSMKLLLLLSDEAQIAHRRDAELKLVQEEKDGTKNEAAQLLDELLRRPGQPI